MDIKRALEALGYRVLPDGKSMCKPYGFSMLKYDLETNRISSLFYGSGTVKDIITWDSEEIKPTDKLKFLEDISSFERYNKTDHGRYVNFAFETAEQYWNNTL